MQSHSIVHSAPSPQAASLRFGCDLRLLEVRRLLRSSAPVTLRVGNVPEPSDAGKCRAGDGLPCCGTEDVKCCNARIFRPQRSVDH